MQLTSGEVKKYIIRIRPFIVFSAYLFIGSIFAGYFIAHNYDRETAALLDELKKKFLPSREYSQLKIFVYIFENNLTVLSVSLLFSLVAGISSLLIVIANGIILGVFAVIVSESVSTGYLIAGILPHGIFEIPAMILTSAIGLRIGMTAILKLFGRKMSLAEEIFDGFGFYIFIIIPLLFVAAFVESFITPVILSLA